ncbi:MAG: ZIP family metal transporter [Candidatus Pacearchaeota archaeon]
MWEIFIYALISVIIISLASLIGITTLSIKTSNLEKILTYMIAFSAGTLLGDAFLHLIPEIAEKNIAVLQSSSLILFGIGFSFFLEKIIHWRHCHHPTTPSHPHPITTMSLFGDGIHNLLDGIIIGASYIISIPTGIATTIAVLFHEIPQEIGDFSMLVYGGFSKSKAILFNFLVALTSIIGVILSVLIGNYSSQIASFVIPFAAGNFIYIATADLIPELHKHSELKKSLIQLALFILGICVMAGLLLVEI